MDKNLDTAELESLVLPLLQLCRSAAQVIGEHYHASDAGAYEAKGDDSPLTRADMASDDILQVGLRALDRKIPVLSEESVPVDLAQRSLWRRYWLIDPLDGTREFLDRTDEFTINIALIEHHRPVLGVLYLPLEHSAFVGIPGLAAVRYVETNGQWLPQDELSTRKLVAGQPLGLLASRRHRGRRLTASIEWLEANWGQVDRCNSGSALKFCQLVAGQGDFYPRFSPCCEWDTAAGQALLEAAGGSLLGIDGAPLEYNRKESLYSPYFFGLADKDHPLWQTYLAHIRGYLAA